MASETPGSGSRGKPVLFNSELFGSPVATGSGGGLSTLGLGEIFNSPFALAPAAPVEQKLSSFSPSATPPSRSPEPPRRSPETDRRTQPSSVTQGGQESDTGELSTIPLDSPSLVQMSTAAAAPVAVTSGAGWNDPPLLPQFSTPVTHRSASQPPPAQQDAVPSGMTSSTSAITLTNTMLSRSMTDPYPVQPLAGRTAEPGTTSAGPLPPVTPSVSSNPYRMGATGKRPAAAVYTAGQPPSSLPQPSSSFSPAPPQPPPQQHPSYQPPPLVTTATSFSTAVQDQHQQPGFQHTVLPVRPHWFYLRSNERYWFPFSRIDSGKLEEAFIRSQANPTQEYVVCTDGGRYDVNMRQRQRKAVYWDEPVCSVRRCSWFYKGQEDRWYMPYKEEEADTLEQSFMSAATSGNWNCRVELGAGEAVIMHSPSSLVHYPAAHFQPLRHDVDYQPRVVLRGFAELNEVGTGEDRIIDHVVFVVHGIGPLAELSFRNLVDAVDDFREVAQLMLKTHRFSKQMSTGGRVEFLPIHWHTALFGDSSGVDDCVRSFSLPSISRLREFTNSTLIDVLFYTSPLYYQAIINHVSSEMNRLLDLFKQRNPGFSGGVSVMGHALGSCILFDLLAHQGEESVAAKSVGVSSGIEPTAHSLQLHPQSSQQAKQPQPVLEEEGGGEDVTPTLEEALLKLGLSDLVPTLQKEQIDFESLLMLSSEDLKEVGVPMGPRKKLASYITTQKQQQEERQSQLEARRLMKEEQEQQQQDVADSNLGLQEVKYIKGVGGIGQPHASYPRLNFEPCHLFTLGSPIALLLTTRGVDTLGTEYQLPTCSNVFNIFHPHDPMAYRLEPLVASSPPAKAVLMAHHKGRKRFHLELYENLERAGASVKQYLVEGIRNMWQQLNELARAHTTKEGEEQQQQQQLEIDDTLSSVSGGDLEQDHLAANLNQNRRLDYVLQERPIERLNEYLFAIGSHLGYWRSEDTALFLLKEIYEEPHPQLIKS